MRAPLLLAFAMLLAIGCTAREPPAGQPWIAGPALPDGRRRLESGVTSIGGRLVIAGGFATSVREGLRLTREVLVLDTFTGEWSALPDAPMALTHINLAASGSALFLLGGLEGAMFTAHGESWQLDLGSNVWYKLAPMPEGLQRGAAAVVASPPHIFLLGGASTTSALATCLDYNVITGEWSQLPDLPSPRSHGAAMRMADGTLILAGGLATLDATQPLSEVLALPPQATAWERRRNMPTARGGCAYGVAVGQLLCAGGESGRIALGTVEGYDPIGDVWYEYPEMPVDRAGTQGAVIGERLYVPGGAQVLAYEPTDTLYVFSVFSALDTAAPP